MAYVQTGDSIADDTVVLRQLKGSPVNIGEYDSGLQVIVDALNDLNIRLINIIAGECSNVYPEYSVTIASHIAECAHSSAYYVLDTEGGGASDVLTQITGLGTGSLAILSCESSDRVITVEHGTYLKLAIGRDFILNNVRDKIMLRHLGSNVCEEITRSSNK